MLIKLHGLDEKALENRVAKGNCRRQIQAGPTRLVVQGSRKPFGRHMQMNAAYLSEGRAPPGGQPGGQQHKVTPPQGDLPARTTVDPDIHGVPCRHHHEDHEVTCDDGNHFRDPAQTGLEHRRITKVRQEGRTMDGRRPMETGRIIGDQTRLRMKDGRGR
ncbi:hypothetical protein [Pannonibacter tanglangensis]|uniref:Uncharacterized protein n=1 Tax=Pannonibacter tanglangensis TaxID=2750084 RepID=A0ABW9ZJ30_9HYPH|nr:hypothetical protein [Pannonibacter sp. XCT-34]NBN64811.1 hypothetical protein [Pannonibacter sp. XCT-34]